MNPSAATLLDSLPPGIERFPVTDRASWLARRKDDVTASAIAALLGQHPYITPFQLYAQKTGAVAEEGVEPRIEANSVSLPPMMRGTALEPIVPDVLRHLRPAWDVQPAGFYYRDPVARIGATPDFFAIDPTREGFGSIQVKTCDQLTLRRSWTADGVIEPPLFIVMQAIVEAALTGASWCSVAVLATGFNLDLHLIEMPIHAGIMERLKAEVAAFWRGIEAGRPPDVDAKRDGLLLEKLWRGDGPEVDLSADNEVPILVDEREALSAQKGEAEARLKEIKALLLTKVGPDAGIGTLADGRRITVSRVERKGYEVKPSSYVDLRIKTPKRTAA